MRAANPRNPTSWNMRLYAHGDPVNLNDPTGRDPAELWGYCLEGNDYICQEIDDLENEAESEEPGVGGEYDDDDSGDDSSDDDTQSIEDCVQAAITAGLNAALAPAGLTLAEIGGDATVQIVNTPDPDGGYYTETELNITGVDLASLIQGLCTAGFYNNGQCPGNAGATWGVGKPHKYHHGKGGNNGRFSGNFRSRSVTGSVQVNTLYTTSDGVGDIQIDIDQFNPASGVLGLILHGVAQVFPNMLTSSDNTYGCY